MIIFKFLRTILTYILVIIFVLIVFLPCLVIILLPAKWRYDNKFFFWIAHNFYRASLWATFLPIRIEGIENIPNSPVIIAANHQSALDIPLVGVLLGTYPHIWMAWDQLRKSWFGPIISRMAVLVHQASPIKAMKSLLRAIEMVKDKNRHVIIFPEGSRSTGNEVADFFAGFVILAKKTGRPVVPVLLLDAYKAYPAGSFFINLCPVKVVVGKPINYTDFAGDDEFKDYVYNWFVSGVREFELTKK